MMGMMGMGMGDDEAEAVGDPHLTTLGGEKSDLCCEDGECHACSPALLQEDISLDSEQNPANLCKSGMGMMGMGMGDDEAEAVGDPHLTTLSGEQSDLCCEDGECHACPPALLQEDISLDSEQNPANLCKS